MNVLNTLNSMCAQSLSLVLLFLTPWTVACQAPLSTEFSRQENWGGLPFPSLVDLPDPGIEPSSPALAGRFFTTELPGVYFKHNCKKKKKKENKTRYTELLSVYCGVLKGNR